MDRDDILKSLQAVGDENSEAIVIDTRDPMKLLEAVEDLLTERGYDVKLLNSHVEDIRGAIDKKCHYCGHGKRKVLNYFDRVLFVCTGCGEVFKMAMKPELRQVNNGDS